MRRVALILSFVTCTAIAQQVEVPHVFQSGTRARAAEVNANFQTLVEAINANQTAIQSLQGGLAPIGTIAIDSAPYNAAAVPIYLLEWDNVFPVSGGGGAGIPQFGDITIGKAYDLFSPQMLLDFATGKALPALRIELTSADSTVTRYTFTPTRISGIGGVTVGGATSPLETVSFSSYATVEIETTDASNNKTTACWSIQANAAC